MTVQPLGGAPEMQLLCDRNEVPGLADLDHHDAAPLAVGAIKTFTV